MLLQAKKARDGKKEDVYDAAEFLSSLLLIDHQNPLILKGMNTWALVSFALIGFIVGYVAHGMGGTTLGRGNGANRPTVVQPTPTPTPTPTAPAAAAVPNPPTEDDDFVLGDEDAAVTMIEFTDYQCPFCSRHFTQTFGQIKSEYIDTGKVKYIVRDFPLSIHPNAPKASEATECADDQGKFWGMHDAIFTKQALWSSAPNAPELFKQYAAELNLNTGTFNDCLDSGKHAAEVQKDFADGSAGGVTGTPAFFINGKKLSGAVPFANFKAAIDAELAN
ncbi:MAG: DsbA family protein [Patescibacteria group bacterium]